MDTDTTTSTDHPDPAGRSASHALVGLAGLALIAVLAVIVAFAVIVLPDDGNDIAAPPPPGEGGGGDATVSLTEFAIDGDLDVAAGTTLLVSNDGTIEHDLVVEETDVATALLAAGESEDLSLTPLDPASYVVFCSVEGHRESGMEAELVVN